MPILPEKALLTVEVRGWTGWSRAQPKPAVRNVVARAGERIDPEVLDIPGGGYEIVFLSMDWKEITLTYRGVVVTNHDGTINLSAPLTGRAVIKVNHSLKLATPTMDGGTVVTVTLNGFQ